MLVYLALILFGVGFWFCYHGAERGGDFKEHCFLALGILLVIAGFLICTGVVFKVINN